MIMLPAAILGALIGYWKAHRKGGVLADKLHSITVHAIAFFLAGLFASIILDWLNWI